MSIVYKQQQVNEFVRANLKECCKDILTWHDTGTLPEGKVREAAALLCDQVFSGRQLVHVEHAVNRIALEKCSI